MATKEPEYPAPPCKFRCNRSRMIMTVSVALHHVGAAHVNLRTSKDKIELDTLQSRRKYKLSRAYPRGILCDDKKTTARMDGNSLIVEMPITKLPEVSSSAPAPAKKSTVAGKRHLDGGEAQASDADASAPRKKAKQARGDASSSGSASDVRTRELMEAASEAADARRDAGLAKIRRLQEADEEKEQRAQAKQAERAAKKQILLQSFKKQQAMSKAEAKTETQSARAAEERRAATAAAKSGSPKKRVSFA